MSAPESFIRWRGAPRLIASRYPSVGLFDRVATADDLDAVIELEGWTNDRINTELGILGTVPREDWVVGTPMASVVMAAFCHPRPGGARFTAEDRGAWYAGRTLETALAESVHRRTEELRQVNGFETRVQMRVYLADFSARFHDVRGTPGAGRRGLPVSQAIYDPDDYAESQRLGCELRDGGSNGIVYRSVRDPGGECIACFKPRLVRKVRIGGHYEFRWEGRPQPLIRRL